MKKLNLSNLEELLIGCAVLGSGGGGEAGLLYNMTKVLMEKSGPVSLINLSDLKPDDVILPVGYMGAPSVETEKLASGNEFDILIKHAEEALGKKITVVMPFEIGGGNAFAPFMIAAKMGLPILDADTMGRAFPEVQMTSCSLLNANSPGFITDCLGNTVVLYAKDSETMEKIARQSTIAMGSCAAFAFFVMNSIEAEKLTIHKSISRALSIGKAIKEAKQRGKDPIDAVLVHCKGVRIASGKITDIDHMISKGFLHGSVTIQNKTDKINLSLFNEFLVAKKDDKVLASTPDILVLLEQETGAVIDVQQVQYGLKVHLVALPAPAIWTTSEGLARVGPRYFGYEIDYQPINQKTQGTTPSLNQLKKEGEQFWTTAVA